jgi:hypothetical protein
VINLIFFFKNLPKWQIYTEGIGKLIKTTTSTKIEVIGRQVNLKNKIND